VLLTALKFNQSSPSATLWDMLTVYRVLMRLKRIVEECGHSATVTPNDRRQNTGDIVDLTECSQQSSHDNHSASLTNKLPSQSDKVRVLLSQMEDSLRASTQFQRLVEEIIDVNALAKVGGSTDSYLYRKATRSQWIQIRPSFSKHLQEYNDELQGLWQRMQAELDLTRQLAGQVQCHPPNNASVSGGAKSTASRKRDSGEISSASLIQLEYNHVHGFHFRVTKKEESKVMKVLKTKMTVTVLATLKAGTLFVTKKVFLVGENVIIVKSCFFFSFLI
jgi:hypothetical protein